MSVRGGKRWRASGKGLHFPDGRKCGSPERPGAVLSPEQENLPPGARQGTLGAARSKPADAPANSGPARAAGEGGIMLRRGGTLAGALALAALLGLPPDGGLGSLWSWIWSAVAAPSCDHGLMIDPNGCPRSQEEDGQPAPSKDDGASIDPDG